MVRILQNTSDTLLKKQKRERNSAVVKLLWQHMAVRGNVHCARCLFRIADGGGAVGEPDLLSISHLLSLTLTLYEVLLFPTLIPCQHQEEWPLY